MKFLFTLWRYKVSTFEANDSISTPRSHLMNLFLLINEWCNPYFKQVVSILKSERFMIGTQWVKTTYWRKNNNNNNITSPPTNCCTTIYFKIRPMCFLTMVSIFLQFFFVFLVCLGLFVFQYFLFYECFFSKL